MLSEEELETILDQLIEIPDFNIIFIRNKIGFEKAEFHPFPQNRSLNLSFEDLFQVLSVIPTADRVDLKGKNWLLAFFNQFLWDESIDGMKAVIERGLDYKERVLHQHSLLVLGRETNPEIIEYLIELGANVNDYEEVYDLYFTKVQRCLLSMLYMDLKFEMVLFYIFKGAKLVTPVENWFSEKERKEAFENYNHSSFAHQMIREGSKEIQQLIDDWENIQKQSQVLAQCFESKELDVPEYVMTRILENLKRKKFDAWMF